MKIYRVYVPRLGVPYVCVRARSKTEAVARAYKRITVMTTERP